jgi:hypothetical protein
MSFSWAGAAAGAADARRQQQQDAMAAQEFELRKRALEAQLAGQEDARLARQEERTRQAERDRTETARVLSGLLTPGEITPQQAARLQDTVFGDALLESRQVLPSRTGLGVSERIDPGGQSFSVFTGTPEQRQSAAQRTAREQVLKDPNLPPIVGRLVRLRDVGIALPNPESLITPEERAAAEARKRETDFADYTRRADYQNELVKGRQRPRVTGTLVREDPKLPAGVQKYFADLKRRGYTRAQAEAEVYGIWDQLSETHPRLDVNSVSLALQRLFPAEGSFGNFGGSVPAPSGRAAGAGPGGGASRPVAPAGAPTAPRSATSADVQKVAQRLKITPAEARKQLEARGVTITD